MTMWRDGLWETMLKDWDFESICGAERDKRVWGVEPTQGANFGAMGPEHSREEILCVESEMLTNLGSGGYEGCSFQ